jgi:hypothetical protein
MTTNSLSRTVLERYGRTLARPKPRRGADILEREARLRESTYTGSMPSSASPGSLLTVIACAGALWIACVGDDPGSGEGADAGANRSGGACATVTSTDQLFDCPLAGGGKETCAKATKACCPGTGCVDRAAACPAGKSTYGCVASPSCESEGKVCCILGAFDPTPACGLASVVVPTGGGTGQCTDPPLCKDGMVQLCSTGSDCLVGECKPTAIVADGISFIVSTCR